MRSDISMEAMPLFDARPKYRLIKDYVLAAIQNGTLVDSLGKLPAEQDLARRFGVAYMTLRAAMNELVAEGVLMRLPGKGTFVRQDTPPVTQTAAGVLALLVPSLHTLWNVAGLYYFPGIVQGFCSEATRLGYEPVIIGRAPDAIRSGNGEFAQVAGTACLLIGHEDSEAMETLADQRRDMAVVGINRYTGRRAFPCVVADQKGAVADAVRRLATQGHRRFAFLPGPPENLGAEERRAGFTRGIAALPAEWEVKAEIVEAAPADYSDLSGVLRARELLRRPENLRPTALLTAGDLIAVGAMQAAREANRSVPEELSIVGFGDFQIAAYTQPSLSTARLPLTELGAKAAALLHYRLQNLRPRRRLEVLPVTLVERDSASLPEVPEGDA